MASSDFVVCNGSSFRIFPTEHHTFDSVKNNEGITQEISGFNVKEARFLDSLDIFLDGKLIKLSNENDLVSDQRTIFFKGSTGEQNLQGKALIYNNVLHISFDIEDSSIPHVVGVRAHGDFMGTFMQRKYPVDSEKLAAITVSENGLKTTVGDNEYSGQLYVNGQAVNSHDSPIGEVETTFINHDGHVELALDAKYRKVGEDKDITHPSTIAPFEQAQHAAQQEFENFHYHLLSVSLPEDGSQSAETKAQRSEIEQQLSMASNQLYTLSVPPQIQGMEDLKCTAAGYPAFMRPFSRDTLCSILEGGYPPEIVNNTLIMMANTIAEDGHLFHEIYDGPEASLTPFTLKGHHEKCLAYDSPNLWLKVLGEYIEQTNHLDFLNTPEIKDAIGKIIAWNQSQLETYGYNAYVSANSPECWDEERKIGDKNIDSDHNNGLFHLAWMDGGLAKTTAEGNGFLGYPQGSIELTTQQFEAMNVLSALQNKVASQGSSLLNDEQMQNVKEIADLSKQNLQSKFWIEKEALKESYGVIRELNDDVIQSIAAYSGVADSPDKTPVLSEEALVNIKQDAAIMAIIEKLEQNNIGVFATKGAPYTDLSEDERIQRFVDIANHYAALPQTFFVDIVAGGKDTPWLPSGNLASNIHHALGVKGLLSDEQISATIEQLSNPDYGLFNPEFGLRTLSEHAVKYSPHEYQRGAIWPYDTALAMKHIRMQGDICKDEGKLALAEQCYGAVKAYANALNNVLEVNKGTFPELLDAQTGVREAKACDPQQWSLQVPFATLTALTGMDIKRPAVGEPLVSFDPIQDEHVLKTYFPLKLSLEIGHEPYEVKAQMVDNKVVSTIHRILPAHVIHSAAETQPMTQEAVALQTAALM